MKKIPLFVAGLLLGALLVSPLFAQPREYVFFSGKVSATDEELEQGYVAISEDVAITVKPGSDLHRLFVRYRARPVYITVETTLPDREKIER